MAVRTATESGEVVEFKGDELEDLVGEIASKVGSSLLDRRLEPYAKKK